MVYKNESGDTNVQQSLWRFECLESFYKVFSYFIFCKMSKTFLWGLHFCFWMKTVKIMKTFKIWFWHFDQFFCLIFQNGIQPFARFTEYPFTIIEIGLFYGEHLGAKICRFLTFLTRSLPDGNFWSVLNWVWRSVKTLQILVEF